MHRYSSMPLVPYTFHNGWLRIRGISLDEKRIPAMFAKLGSVGEVQIERKSRMSSDLLRENLVLPTSALVSALTLKQAESLLAAVEMGYYRVPRAVRIEDISQAFNVPRTTYSEHVRKAESKVIGAVAPFLEVYFGRRYDNSQ